MSTDEPAAQCDPKLRIVSGDAMGYQGKIMDRHVTWDPLGDGIGVLVQPDDGILPLLELIGSAERSVWIKQFTFTHPDLLNAGRVLHGASMEARYYAARTFRAVGRHRLHQGS